VVNLDPGATVPTAGISGKEILLNLSSANCSICVAGESAGSSMGVILVRPGAESGGSSELNTVLTGNVDASAAIE
jgi:hypothetical protein